MSRWTLQNFLRDVGLRPAAAAVVVVTFVGLGYATRTNLFGVSALLDSQLAFFTATFPLLGGVGLGWIAVQQSCG
jgi:hypothetical protein